MGCLASAKKEFSFGVQLWGLTRCPEHTSKSRQWLGYVSQFSADTVSIAQGQKGLQAGLVGKRTHLTPGSSPLPRPNNGLRGSPQCSESGQALGASLNNTEAGYQKK